MIYILFKKNIKDHDVNTWGEDDVFDWIKNIGAKNELDLCQYSELFRSHNINGKRLLMMDEDALRKIGITSVGHIIELDVSFFPIVYFY